MNCEKCNGKMTLRLVQNEKYFITELLGCTSLRCGYMFRLLKSNK